MAQRASGRADREGEADLFPWVVSLGCIVVGIALFLHSTMPALAENRELETRERQLREEIGRIEREAAALAEAKSRLARDPERLRAAFDAQHLTPAEAIELGRRDGSAPATATGGPPKVGR